MSEENVEVLAAAIDALNARDVDGETADALFHDEIEWRPARSAGGAVEGAVYRGKSGMIKYVEDVDSGFDELQFEIPKFEPVGSDRVFYRGRIIARGSGSGVPLDVPVWGLWEIRDGKLFRGVGFLTEKEALEAAGLPE
jgi:ketosteroid isomerase-like protein